MGRLKVLFPVLLFLTAGIAGGNLFSLTPSSDVIVLDLWTEVSKIVPLNSNDPAPDSLEKLSKTILSDGRWILSGMIYGFDVVYVPENRERGIKEVFKVTPLGEIPFGDPALRVTDSNYSSGRFTVQIRYDLAEYQIRRLSMWSSNIYPEAEGLGRASLFEGKEARTDSVKDGIKNALRNYFRARIKNKPREIKAKVLLDQPPYIIIDAGGYTSKTRIKLSVSGITPYTVY